MLTQAAACSIGLHVGFNTAPGQEDGLYHKPGIEFARFIEWSYFFLLLAIHGGLLFFVLKYCDRRWRSNR